MDTLSAIRERRTHKRFTGAPVPEAQLETLLDLARWAPNHRLTEPWRFSVVVHARIPDLARTTVGAIADSDHPKLLAKRQKLERQLPLLGAFVAVYRTPVPDDPLLDREDYAACCCAVQNLLLGATALGLGSFWSTGRVFGRAPVPRCPRGCGAGRQRVAGSSGGGAAECAYAACRAGHLDPLSAAPTASAVVRVRGAARRFLLRRFPLARQARPDSAPWDPGGYALRRHLRGLLYRGPEALQRRVHVPRPRAPLGGLSHQTRRDMAEPYAGLHLVAVLPAGAGAPQVLHLALLEERLEHLVHAPMLPAVRGARTPRRGGAARDRLCSDPRELVDSAPVHRLIAVSLAVLLGSAPGFAKPPPAPRVGVVSHYRATADRILDAALNRRGAFDKLVSLCDGIGPRLSGSPGLDRAVAWAAQTLRDEGHERVRTEPVAVPKWVRGRESLALVVPYAAPIGMLGLGGSVGTPPDGITAEVVVAEDEAGLRALGDRAAGRIVLFNKRMPPYDPKTGTHYGETVEYRVRGAALAAGQGAVAALVRSVTARSLATPHTGAMDSGDAPRRIPAAASRTRRTPRTSAPPTSWRSSAGASDPTRSW